MGSSSIGSIVIGITGPTGPTGPRGNTGATGTGSGKTGPTGLTGNYVVDVRRYKNKIDLDTSEKNYFTIEGTKGPTGFTGIAYGENIGTGLSLYSTSNGNTLTIRGISFTQNLSAEITGGILLITPKDVNYGVTLFSGITSSRVVYSRKENEIGSSRIMFGKTHGDFSFSQITGISSGYLSTYSEIQGNLVEIAADTTGLILGITKGAVYKIATPVGLSGFTLDLSMCNDNELISATILLEGNDVTQFPNNVYFEDSPYSTVFGCGMNIMNIMTYDKGENWFATIIDRGYGVTLCPGFEGLGSCCYLDGGDYDCVEYVTRQFCDTQNGRFNLFKACGSTCGPISTCCSNGNCVAGIEKEECEYFGGKYYTGIECEGDDDDSVGNDVRLCYKDTMPPTCCCVNGTCIGNVTFEICTKYYKGHPLYGNCCDVNCNANPPRGISGACCNYSTSSCSENSPAGCSAEGGIFFGDGTTCGGVNCCFESPLPTGSCCLDTGDCIPNVIQTTCVGTFREGVDCTTPCPQPPVDITKGLCCATNSCSSNVSREECMAIDSNARFFPNLIFNDWTANPFKWEAAQDCEFCNASRYAMMVSGSDDGNNGNPLALDFRCFKNKYNPQADDEILNGWSPRISIQHNDYGNTNKILLNSSFVYLDTACGSVDYTEFGPGDDVITGREQKFCLKDSFIAGHIFTRKRIHPTNEIFADPEINQNSTQSEFRNFIYSKYMQDILWVIGDYEKKICNSLCNSLTSSNGSVEFEFGCCCGTCFCVSASGTCNITTQSFSIPSLCTFFKRQAQRLISTNCVRCGGGCCYSGAGPGESTYVLGGFDFITSQYCARTSFQDLQGGAGFDQEPVALYDVYNNLITTNVAYSCQVTPLQFTETNIKINEVPFNTQCGGNPDPCKELI